MTNRDKFLAILAAANVPTDTKRGTLHGGLSERGGAYVNLLVLSQSCYGGEVQPDEILEIVVYQRYLDDANLFTICNEPHPMGRENFMIAKNGDHDFSLLEKLLAKETLQFNDYCWADGQRTIDPNNWVKIALQ